MVDAQKRRLRRWREKDMEKQKKAEEQHKKQSYLAVLHEKSKEAYDKFAKVHKTIKEKGKIPDSVVNDFIKDEQTRHDFK